MKLPISSHTNRKLYISLHALIIMFLVSVISEASARIIFHQKYESCTKTACQVGGQHIMSMNDDGTNVVDLTLVTGVVGTNDMWPNASWDGTKIAFWSERSGTGFDIYTMDINGANIFRVTHENYLTEPVNSRPVWTYDGTKLIYTQFDKQGNSHIYQIDSDNTSKDAAEIIYTAASNIVYNTWSIAGDSFTLEEYVLIDVVNNTTPKQYTGIARLGLDSYTLQYLTGDTDISSDGVDQYHAVQPWRWPPNPKIEYIANDPSNGFEVYLGLAHSPPIWPANEQVTTLSGNGDIPNNVAWIGPLTDEIVVAADPGSKSPNPFAFTRSHKAGGRDTNIYDDQANSLSWATENIPPIADAGMGQTVHPGTQIVLDGSASFDPDNGYPLQYSWFIIEGSGGTLVDEDTVNPTFESTVLGDFVVILQVTDAQGVASLYDAIVLSSGNNAPVADAGPDQAVIELWNTVQLDGSNSFDLDNDPLSFNWEIVSLPPGSAASLDAANISNPIFVPDVQGTYEFELTVNDTWETSAPDNVIVSFTNVEPVADPGGNLAVTVGDIVSLDGSASSDANGDPLTYSWNLVTVPAGSAASLSSINSVTTSFTADVAGNYVVSLVVNDGYVDSASSNVNIVAVSVEDQAISILQESVDVINDVIDPADLQFGQADNILTNKINQALNRIDNGNINAAINSLMVVLSRTDGCATGGAPDPTDWVEDCDAQAELYPLILEAINLLESL